MENWTVLKLLNWITDYFTKAGIESPRLSAEMLLGYVLEMKRIELYVNFEKPVSKERLDKLHGLVKRAVQYEPIAYLVGSTEFYSLNIKVTADTLIPRPETELLVERAVEFLRRRSGGQYVLDLCTGSGCVAAAIAKNHSGSKIIATDISDAALAVAAENIAHHELADRVELLEGDLFEPVIKQLDTSKFDLVVCNPPYLSTVEYESLESNVKDYEPSLALLAGEQGLDVYKRIAQRIDEFLKPDGALMLEVGYAQGPAVNQLLEQAGGFALIKIEKDFADNDRVVSAYKQTPPGAHRPDLLDDIETTED